MFSASLSLKHLAFSLLMLFICTLSFFDQRVLHAAETTLAGLDLEVYINSTWTGCHSGGYWPIRVRTINKGPKRTIRYTISPVDSSQNNLSVSTSFSIDQGVTLDETILIPMISDNIYFNFKTTDNGYNAKELSTNFNLESTSTIPLTPAILLINRDSSSTVKELEEASVQIQTIRNSSSSSSYSSNFNHNVAYVAGYPQNLPATWLGYSGIDVVVCDLDNFVTLEAQRQEAIISWVQAGGSLILYQSELPDEIIISTTAKFTGTKLELNNPAWKTFRADTSQAFRMQHNPATGEVTRSAARTRDYSWPIKDKNLRQMPVMMGQVTWVPCDLSKGNVTDWSWLLQDNQLQHTKQSDKTGVHSRGYNTTFGSFSIPGIQSVPVTAFLILITAFTIIIGPMNYMYFQRKKQLAMLLVSIPVLAFSTSVLLILYATLAHGFSVKGRVRSLMYVDQQANKSVTLARSAIYAGQAPSRLKFSPETVVYPIWPQQNGFERGTVDWSNSQQLMQGGWVRSRTRTQFYTMNVKIERGRLNIEAPLAGKLPVTNGFEFDLAHVVVADSTGQLYVGNNIAAGKSAELTPLATSEERNKFSSAFSVYSSGESNYMEPDSNDSPYGRYGYGSNLYTREVYQNEPEQLRKIIAQAIQEESPEKSKATLGNLAQKSYFAVLKRNNKLDLGISSISERESSHVLIGKY